MIEQLSISWNEFGEILFGTGLAFVAVICYTRLSGLRSFSKISAFDFAMTVAVGSVFASAILAGKPKLSVALVALACLFAGQTLIAWLRRRFSAVSRLLDNRPVLLMRRGKILKDNLRAVNLTHHDLLAKLRQANVAQLAHVHAVVFETTGDVSVLHGDDGANDGIDLELLTSVKQ